MSDPPVHENLKADRAARIAGRLERWVALVVLGVPLLYLVTEHSYSPVLWHYSIKLLGAIAVWGGFLALILASYRVGTPEWFAALRRIGIVAGGWIIVGALFAELVLTVIDPRPDPSTLVRHRGYAPDPEVGYVYIPNHRQSVVTPEYAVEWQTNSQRVRADREYGPRPDGVTRVLGLGDSFTVSVGTSLEETWPGVLERRLNDEIGPSGTFEVINGGHSAWGTMQQTTWLRRVGDRFDPDIVLLAMTPNDIGDNTPEPPGYYTAVDGYLTDREATTETRIRFEHRQKWYSLPGQIERSRLVRQIGLLFPNPPAAALMPHALELDPEWTRHHGLTEDYLLELRDIAVQQGARFGLILLTFRGQLTDLPEGYAPEAFGERRSRCAEAHEIPVADTYPIVRSHPDPQSLFWRSDNHYNVAGEKMAGDVAFDLMRMRFIDEPGSRGPDP